MQMGEDRETYLARLTKTLAHDSNWLARANAAKTLGFEKDAGAIEPLLAALHDPHPEVRSSALGAFGNIGDSRVVDVLLDILKIADREPTAYWTNSAAWSLGRLQETRAVEPLVHRLQHPQVSMRMDAAEALGNIGDNRAVGPLIDCLDDEDYFVRAAAAHSLGDIGDLRAVDPLIRCLKDSEKHVRSVSARALGRLRDSRAVQSLIEALDGDDHDLMCFAASALGEIGDPAALQPLIRVFEREPLSSGLRAWAGGPVGKVGQGNELAFEVLMRELGNQDTRIRIAAVDGLGYLRDTRAIPALEKVRRQDKGIDDDTGESVKSAARIAIKRIMKH